MGAEPILATPHHDLRQPLVRYLISLGLSSDESQDVAQEVFLKLHRHLSSGADASNVRGWVFRVAHNEARNRQNAYERRYSGTMDGVDAAGGSDPEAALLEKEKRKRLREAVRALPPLERECLRLRAEGKRYREIGEALKVPLSTVADTVERAIRKLAGSV
jgi:RNA polymerase sigma-70 factor (ECF subfamily)